jgi:hypothetical protein
MHSPIFYRITSGTRLPKLTLAVLHLVAKPGAFIALDARLLLLLLPRCTKSLAQPLRRGRRRVPERVPEWRTISCMSLPSLCCRSVASCASRKVLTLCFLQCVGLPLLQSYQPGRHKLAHRALTPLCSISRALRRRNMDSCMVINMSN